MKVSSLFHFACLFIALSALVVAVEGGRGKGKRKMKKCVYKRKGERGVCNQETGNMEITYQLRSSRMRFDCPPSRLRTRKCPGCKYPKRGIPWSECEGGMRSKVVPLGPGSKAGCPPKRLISKPCKKRGGRRKKGRRMKGKGMKKKGCVYANQDWSQCDVATNTRQRERKLVVGDPKLCLPKKVVTKKCKKECRYIKGEWSVCDHETNTKNRTLDPKPGSLVKCESKVQTKGCLVGAPENNGRATKCRYKYGKWSECDSRTNSMTREMTLKNGDPNKCKRSAQLTRKCKAACKFLKGQWSECDPMTRLMTRNDTLVKGNAHQCEKHRVITKKCRKAKCKYTLGDWGECSPNTNSRTRLKTLVGGDRDKCPQSIPITKPCLGKDGEARCFFGSWGEFGPCKNGVVTKQRQLIQGGMECERKAVAFEPCKG